MLYDHLLSHGWHSLAPSGCQPGFLLQLANRDERIHIGGWPLPSACSSFLDVQLRTRALAPRQRHPYALVHPVVSDLDSVLRVPLGRRLAQIPVFASDLRSVYGSPL